MIHLASFFWRERESTNVYEFRNTTGHEDGKKREMHASEMTTNVILAVVLPQAVILSKPKSVFMVYPLD